MIACTLSCLYFLLGIKAQINCNFIRTSILPLLYCLQPKEDHLYGTYIQREISWNCMLTLQKNLSYQASNRILLPEHLILQHYFLCSTVKYGTKPPPANVTCVPYTLGKYTFMNSKIDHLSFPSGRMNREVLYLVGIFFVGCVAIIFRSISFNLAGERFVARLRKKVMISRKNSNFN